MKKKNLLYFICLPLLLTGCSSSPQIARDGQKWQEEWTRIGANIGIDAPEQFTLLDNKDVLAPNGLYYTTWVTGNSVSYENNDGNTIDLYDAELYFLTSEANSEQANQKNYADWLSAAKENYDVHSENTIICNGQTYTLITYSYIAEDTPYNHGASAFGYGDTNAVCAEFACLENYTENPETSLIEFLNCCHYRAD